jgi:hypothetical protein
MLYIIELGNNSYMGLIGTVFMLLLINCIIIALAASNPHRYMFFCFKKINKHQLDILNANINFKPCKKLHIHAILGSNYVS